MRTHTPKKDHPAPTWRTPCSNSNTTLSRRFKLPLPHLEERRYVLDHVALSGVGPVEHEGQRDHLVDGKVREPTHRRLEKGSESSRLPPRVLGCAARLPPRCPGWSPWSCFSFCGAAGGAAATRTRSAVPPHPPCRRDEGGSGSHACSGSSGWVGPRLLGGLSGLDPSGDGCCVALGTTYEVRVASSPRGLGTGSEQRTQTIDHIRLGRSKLHESRSRRRRPSNL